jgi:hypothetical protein
LSSLVALSDGTLIEAPRSYRGAEERLGRAQRCLSRKKRGSRNREKTRRRVASACERVANQMRDFAYKTRARLNRGIEIGLEQAEYTPGGEATTTQLGVVGQAASMNQEAALLVGW